VQVLQRGAGVRAQLVGQAFSQVPVVGQGVRWAPGAVQRQHVLAGHVLVQRALRGSCRQLRQQLLTVACAQPGVDQVVLGGPSLLLPSVPLAFHPLPAQAGQRLATP
jgi:hypothetical protein